MAKTAIVTAALLLCACQSTGINTAQVSDQLSYLDQPSSTMPQIDIPFEKFTLDNGLRVVVHEDRKAPIVAVSVWYHVGSKDEPTGKTGFAHLFEHLMFNGSENYDDEYFGPFEKVGATDMNGTTWFDRTNYFQNVPTPALDLALWMESDRMGHILGAITQEKLDEQRGVVQNEKRQGDDRPYGKVQYRSLAGLFPAGHPYRHSTIGSMADLDAASLDDVKQWFEDYYGAANTVLVLAGDIDAATARPLVEKYFGDIPAGPPVNQLKAWVPVKQENVIEVMPDNVPQARIYRQWVAPSRNNQETHLLQLAAAVLGSGKNSRLYKALVYDKQLATSAYAYVEEHELSSIFEINVTLKPGADEQVVIAEIDKIVADFLNEGPNNNELSRVVTSINASAIRGFEKIGGFGGKATALARGELYANDPGFYKTTLNWLNNANASTITNVSNKWLTKGYYQITVVPFGEYTVSKTGVDRSTGLPPVGAMPDLSFPEIQRGQLANGMSVVLAERRSLPLVNVALQFDAGYAADANDILGTSSFTLDMLTEGTTSRSSLEISAEAEDLGANIYANSSLDVSNVGVSALKSELDASVALMADIARNPAFSQTEIDRLRKQWLAGIEREQNQPVQIALRNLPPIMYGEGHSYGIPFTGSGTKASINSLSQQDLINFHKTWLRPDNATIYIVGDTTMQEIIPLLNTHFADWSAPTTALPKKNIASVATPTQSIAYLIDKPGAAQTVLLAGHVIPPTGAPDNLITETMNDILGGSFTARVNMNLREDKGWSYGARTITWDARGQRPWIVYAPVQTDKTKESIQELRNEMRDYLSNKPATADELDRVVKNNTNSLPGRYETSGAVLGTLRSNENYGRPDDYVTSLKKNYQAVELSHVRNAAKNILKPNALSWVIVGDLKEIEADVRALGFDAVKIMDVDGNVIE